MEDSLNTDSLYTFVEDFRSEGFDEVLDVIAGELGVGGVTVAAAYHQARDVTPRGRTRVTVRQDGVHFMPSPRFVEASPVQPIVLPGSEDRPLHRLRDLTAARHLTMHAWCVVLHNTSLGTVDPSLASVSCFGDRYAESLCPANPDVRRYAVALLADAARLGVESVVAESLHFGTFEHGHHHERCFVDLGAVDRFLLGLCFCPHCVASSEAATEAREGVRRVLDAVLSGERPAGPDVVTREIVESYAGPAAAAHACDRAHVVTSLAEEAGAAVADAGSRLVLLDLGGALKGYATGEPTGAPAADESWQLGVDLAGIGQHVGLALLAYARDPERVRTDVAAYRARVGDGVAVRAVMRPGPPDTSSGDQLQAKVDAAIEAGATALDYYHYGLVSREVLHRIVGHG